MVESESAIILNGLPVYPIYTTYLNGDAGRSFASLEAAAQYMQVSLKDAIQS